MVSSTYFKDTRIYIEEFKYLLTEFNNKRFRAATNRPSVHNLLLKEWLDDYSDEVQVDKYEDIRVTQLFIVCRINSYIGLTNIYLFYNYE
jgi:hypothetical protein